MPWSTLPKPAATSTSRVFRWCWQLSLLLLLQGLLLQPAAAQVRQRMPFSFTLANEAATSAGVFLSDGTLVRTLWSGVRYSAGSHASDWDGLDDAGNLLADGSYTVKVVSNNVTYEWEGVIGNNSQNKTGSTVNRSTQAITNMVVVGQYAYYAVGYTEGDAASYLKFDIRNPQVRLKVHPRDGHSTCVVASDGTYVYWGGMSDAATNFVAATRTADDTDVTFAGGTPISTGHNVYSAIDLAGSVNITGLAVQKTGNFLLVAHASTNQVRVLDKKTGLLLRSWSVTNPRQLTLTDDNTLWLIHDATTVEKYTLNSQGEGKATGVKLANLPAPVALAASPDGQTVLAVDGALDNQVTTTGNHQVKAYNQQTGSLSWTLGQAGGYLQDPTVRDDKFCFMNTKSFENANYGQGQPYVAFQPDGSFWVGDVGNLRSQHFSASRSYLNQVAYIGYFYSCVVDPNAPKRVFANYLEFEVDYSKALAPDNGSWRLVRNWSYGRQAALDDDVTRLQCLATLSNGRTYALALNHLTQKRQLIELPPSGNIRYTGIEMSNAYQLFSDGSLWSLGDNTLGKPATWTKQALTGFDGSNNPKWGPVATAASTPPVTAADPLTIDGYLRRNQVTSTNIMVAFCSDRPTSAGDRGTGYHLGGVRVGTSNWLWRTSPSTTLGYRGDYPADGAYDIGNGVVYPGSFAQALDRSIFWGYNGEFWKNAQTNKWNHYLDNGLFIGQFGAVQRQDMTTEESPYGMASNAVTGTFVKVGDDYYLYHCDEGFHAGIHRWHISGLSSIQEQTAATFTLAATAGVLQQQFTGGDLNNVNLTSSQLVTTVQTAAQNSSTRWTGFVAPAYSEAYTFYAQTNQKVRLWVNNQLVIDQWQNKAQTELASSSLALQAGTKYPFRLEVSGGPTALSWASASQAKQVVPAARLYTDVLTDATAGIPLSEYLPYASTVEAGVYGWSRDPVTDAFTPNQWGSWLVQTNVTSTNHRTPDVNIQLHPASNGLVNTVARNLSSGSTALSQWTLSGKLIFPISDCDKNQGHGYIQVLDANNKVIARMYRLEVSWPSDMRFYLNSKIVTQTDITTILALGQTGQNFTLTAGSNGLTLRYGNLAAVTAAPFDPTSDWQHPKTLQVLLSSPITDEHELNLTDLRFAANVMPVVPTLLADDGLNTLSAWQTSPWELVVSANGASYVPYTGQILVGNVARPAGYWKFKLRNLATAQEGAVVESPAFTASANPLALQLLSLQATKGSGGQVTVSWRTANEQSPTYFQVERGTDGQQFGYIGTVPSGNPAGTYSLVDKNPLTATTYYRLKILDASGSFTYSQVAIVAGDAAQMTLYPNPAQSVLQVGYPSTAGGHIEVLSVTGATLLSQDVQPGSGAATLTLDALPPGMYYLRYSGGGTSATKAFVKGAGN